VRIYHARETFFWHVDEDIIALTVKRIVVDHHVQLLGFPIPGGIYLGPIFYYIVSFFYFLGNMNPFSLPFFAALLGVFSTFLVYKVGSLIFENRRIGFFAGVIYGFSFLANVYSKVFTGLSFGPIWALLTYLILYRNIKNKKPTNLVALGLILVLASQNEGSSLSLVALSLISWLIFRFKIPRRDLGIIIGAFLLSHLPILIFDLRHNFFVARSILGFFGKHAPPSFNSLNSTLGPVELFTRTLSRFLYVPSPADIGTQILPCFAQDRLGISVWVLMAAVVVFAFFVLASLMKKNISIGQKIVFFHLLILMGGLLLFNLFMKGYLYEWVLVIFFPAFALMVAYFLDSLLKGGKLFRYLVILALALFTFFNLKSTLTSTGRFGLADKAAATKWAVAKISDKPFYLDSLGSCFQNGYVYLFWFYGKMPSSTYADDVFTPTFYPKPNNIPKTGVIMVNPTDMESAEFWRKYEFYKAEAISRQQVGSIEVLIVEDK